MKTDKDWKIGDWSIKVREFSTESRNGYIFCAKDPTDDIYYNCFLGEDGYVSVDVGIVSGGTIPCECIQSPYTSLITYVPKEIRKVMAKVSPEAAKKMHERQKDEIRNQKRILAPYPFVRPNAIYNDYDAEKRSDTLETLFA